MWIFRCSIQAQTTLVSFCKLDRELPVAFLTENVCVCVCVCVCLCALAGATDGVFVLEARWGRLSHTVSACRRCYTASCVYKGATRRCSAQPSVWQHCLFVDVTGVGYASLLSVSSFHPFFSSLPFSFSPSLPSAHSVGHRVCSASLCWLRKVHRGRGLLGNVVEVTGSSYMDILLSLFMCLNN